MDSGLKNVLSMGGFAFMAWATVISLVLFSYPAAKVLFILLVLVGVGLLLTDRSINSYRAMLRYGTPFLFFVVTAIGLYSFQNGQGEEAWEKLEIQMRFLLLFPLFYLFHRYPISQQRYWLAMVIASTVTGAWAIYEVVQFDTLLPVISGRAKGDTYEILLGDVAMLFCASSLLAALFYHRAGSNMWVGATLSALLAFVAVTLSGSKGALLALPLMMLCLLYIMIHWGWSLRVLVSISSLLIIAVILILSQLPVLTDRVILMFGEIQSYLQGGSDSGSAIERLEMWRAAWMIFLEHPWTGAGLASFQSEVRTLVSSGEIYPVAAHYIEPHNEFLSIMVSRGGIGVFMLLAVYLFPLAFFWQRKLYQGEVCLVAVSGIILVGFYMVFGLTDTLFVDKRFISIYVIIMAVQMTMLLERESLLLAKKTV